VVLDRSHASTHSTWKTCPQLGSARTFSPSASSDRHTAHSVAAAALVEAEAEAGPPPPSACCGLRRYAVTGSAASADASSPWRALLLKELKERRTPAARPPPRPRATNW